MTRWLQAARKGLDLGTKLTELTKPTPELQSTTGDGVLSVLSVLSEGADPISEPPARSDGFDPDAGALLDFLHLHGPSSYGAAATALTWGATRAWRAEAKLRAGGFVRLDSLGRAYPADHNHERNA